MPRKRLDYANIYGYLSSHNLEETATKFGANIKVIALVKNIGDAVLAKNSQPLDSFSPRDLMNELARRGYKGKLQYLQEIDITNF